MTGEECPKTAAAPICGSSPDTNGPARLQAGPARSFMLSPSVYYTILFLGLRLCILARPAGRAALQPQPASSQPSRRTLSTVRAGCLSGVEVGVFVVDAATFAAFTFLALRSERFWPLWLAGLQLTTVFAHMLKAIQLDLMPHAYAAAARFWVYPIFLIIVVGTWRSYRRSDSRDRSTGHRLAQGLRARARSTMAAAMTRRKKSHQSHGTANRPRFWGKHAVAAALDNPDRKVLRAWATRDAAGFMQFPKDVPVTLAEAPDLGRLVPNDAPHQGVVIEVEPLEDAWLDDVLAEAPERAVLLVLDQVTDPHNVGAILRSVGRLRGGRHRHPGPSFPARERGARQGRIGRARASAVGPRRQPRARARADRRGRLLAYRPCRRRRDGAEGRARAAADRAGARRRGPRPSPEHARALRCAGPPADH